MNRLFSVQDRVFQKHDRFYLVIDDANTREEIRRLTTNSPDEIVVEFVKWLKEGKA